MGKDLEEFALERQRPQIHWFDRTVLISVSVVILFLVLIATPLSLVGGRNAFNLDSRVPVESIAISAIDISNAMPFAMVMLATIAATLIYIALLLTANLRS